ncbi:MAG: hypothetical protein KF824_12065 [Fimbriimonadaceae bacterium]|nr:MAG: hypothetical protein KF824_12065 [Fimbriimonadaceae bacterium]
MRFWAPVSISAAWLCLAASSFASTGRFAYNTLPQVPGIEIMRGGVRVAHSVADTVHFYSPIPDLAPKRLSEGEAVFQGKDFAYTPSAIKYSAWRPGAEFYFPLDFRLRMTTDLSPFLTWAEGSVGAEVPSAPSKWHLVSFRDGQAPLMLVFEEPVQLVIGGETGNWILQTTSKFKGWMRILAPLGPKPIGSSVGALGETVQRVKPLAEKLSQPTPVLQDFTVRSDAGGLTAIWTFDRPGAEIPPALLLCKQGGYATRILTGISKTVLEEVEGPIAFSAEPRIVVRFPLRRIPIGRSLSVGTVEQSISSASAFDVPSVVELALMHMAAAPDYLTRDAAATASEEFLRVMVTQIDPITGKRSPLPASGAGADLLAAHALLQASLQSNSLSGKNEFLSSVEDRWDPWSWRIWANKYDTSMRATAIFAAAGASAPDLVTRAKAAMAQAACAAESVMPDYRRKRELPLAEITVVNPIRDLRRAIYADQAVDVEENGFAESLMSPVRIIGDIKILVEKRPNGYLVSWDHLEGKAAEMTLISAFPVEVEAGDNVNQIVPSTFLAETQLKVVPKAIGKCSFLLRLPPWAQELPNAMPPPKYSE